MRIVIQRTLEASVSIDHKIVGKIDRGLVLLVGFMHDDTLEDIQYCVQKLSKMRLFSDSKGNMNLSIEEVAGQILSVSQFTLFADLRKGNRPSFTRSMPFEKANELYTQFNDALKALGFVVETGVFGADMQVSIQNDGPVTILLDSKTKNL